MMRTEGGIGSLANATGNYAKVRRLPVNRLVELPTPLLTGPRYQRLWVTLFCGIGRLVSKHGIGATRYARPGHL